MATNNAINSLDPIQVALGGTGDSTLTQYGVLYGSGTNPIGVTSAGLAGQVLTSNGTGNAPSYTSPAGDGLIFIATQTATSGTSVTFTSGVTAAYNNYMFIINNYFSSAALDNIVCQVSTNGGSSYISSGYLSGNTYDFYNGSYSTANVNSTTSLYVQGAASFIYNGTAYFFGITSGSNPQFCGLGTSYLSQPNSAYNAMDENWCGSIAVSGINAFKFFSLGGSAFTNLSISMYGFYQ